MDGGRIAAVAPRLAARAPRELDAAGRVVIPGLVESHFHLDKALLGAGAPAGAGSVQGAIEATARAKRRFTVEDIAGRARRALELAVRHGTTVMRTHVEVDPLVPSRPPRSPPCRSACWSSRTAPRRDEPGGDHARSSAPLSRRLIRPAAR